MNSGNTTSDPAAQGGETAAERWQRTAIAAFFRAEARGFAPGHELDDWLAAELEISAAGVVVEAAVADAMELPTGLGGDTPSPPAAPPAKRARRAARKPGTNQDQPKAVASRKTAVTKRRSARTRKTSPGVESELGGNA